MLFLVSCKEEPPSSSLVVSKHNNKQRIQVASTKLPLKTDKGGAKSKQCKCGSEKKY